MSVTAKISGGCLCGSVRYEGDGEWQPAIACHCGQCRRQTGSFYMVTVIGNNNFKLLQDDGLSWYQASGHAERGFCNKCGSALFWRSVDNDYAPTEQTAVMLGSLDDPKGIKLTKHIFTGSKGGYYEIADGLPQADTV